jgi:glutamine synthetase
MAEYIWLGSSGADLKSRTVVLDEQPASPEDLPIAEIDGSSYGQAAEEGCEIYLQPKKIFPDPFRGGNHILVLCDTYVPPLVSSRARIDRLHSPCIFLLCVMLVCAGLPRCG